MTNEELYGLVMTFVALSVTIFLIFCYVEENWKLKKIDTIDREKYAVKVCWNGEHSFVAYATERNTKLAHRVKFKQRKMYLEPIGVITSKENLKFYNVV